VGLLDEARAEVRVPGAKCVLVDLDPGLLTEIAAAFDDADLPSAAIARALKARGVKKVTAGILNRHRTNDCTTCRQAGLAW
jgi:hypothetical protein